MQGRVFTLVASLSMAMMPLSLAVAGPVADAVGVQPWYVVGGAAFTLLGAGSFFLRPVVNVEQNGYSSRVASPAGTVREPAASE